MNWNWVKDKLLPAIIMGLIAGALNLFIEVRLLRSDVDRIEVYVDQMWHEGGKK